MGKLLAFDQDADAQQNMIDDERFTFIDQNFQVPEKLYPPA
jgi:16S rRNA (cytosine1402-N4)-methyltransferase